MNYFSAFLAFMGLALLSFFNCRNSAVGILSEAGFNQRYYPKHYITPHRWMKKFYKLKQSSIPKYVFLEFYMAIIFALSGPVNFLIFIFTNGNSKTVGILVMLHCCLIILNTVIFVVMSHCFKKNSKKKKDNIKRR